MIVFIQLFFTNFLSHLHYIFIFFHNGFGFFFNTSISLVMECVRMWGKVESNTCYNRCINQRREKAITMPAHYPFVGVYNFLPNLKCSSLSMDNCTREMIFEHPFYDNFISHTYIIFYFISLLFWFSCKYLLFLCKLWLYKKLSIK